MKETHEDAEFPQSSPKDDKTISKFHDERIEKYSSEEKSEKAVSGKPPTPKKRKINRPFDHAVTVAILALLLSGGQLVFTSPLIIDYYFQPDIVIRNDIIHSPNLKKKLTAFSVINEGRGVAKEIEIGIITFENDKVDIVPMISSKILHDDSAFVRNFTITVPHLNPKEGFSIRVLHHDINHEMGEVIGNVEMDDGEIMQLTSSYPAVVFARTNRGSGRILATRFDLKPVNRGDVPIIKSSPK